jgi:hypothetical protein
MSVADGGGAHLDEAARRAVFERREDAIAFGREFPDWHVYYRNGGFDVPLVADGLPPAMPAPRPILVVEWEQKEGGGGMIRFLSPSAELAQELAGDYGVLSAAPKQTGGLGRGLFELQVCPLYDFEDVLHYLCRIAGPGGVLTNW